MLVHPRCDTNDMIHDGFLSFVANLVQSRQLDALGSNFPPASRTKQYHLVVQADMEEDMLNVQTC